MPRGKKKLKCLRCGYQWSPKVARPAQCPRCKQPEWDRPARAKVVQYSDQREFFNQIAANVKVGNG